MSTSKRQVAKNPGLLNPGCFGFNVALKKLYAGFGKANLRVIFEEDDTGWIEVPEADLLNGWENVLDGEPLAYRIDACGVLHVKGEVRYGALNYAVLRLPEKQWPSRNIRKTIPMRDGFGLVDINVDGYIIPVGSEELEYGENGDPTGAIIEVAYVSLEMSFIL
jgi:hypothetical protein